MPRAAPKPGALPGGATLGPWSLAQPWLTRLDAFPGVQGRELGILVCLGRNTCQMAAPFCSGKVARGEPAPGHVEPVTRSETGAPPSSALCILAGTHLGIRWTRACAVPVMQPTAAPDSCPQCDPAGSAFATRSALSSRSAPAPSLPLWVRCSGDRSSGGKGFPACVPSARAASARQRLSRRLSREGTIGQNARLGRTSQRAVPAQGGHVGGKRRGWLEASGEETCELGGGAGASGDVGVGGAEWRGGRVQRADRASEEVEADGRAAGGRAEAAGKDSRGNPARRTACGGWAAPRPVEERPAAGCAPPCWRFVRETRRPFSFLYLKKHVHPQLGRPLWGHVPRARIWTWCPQSPLCAPPP